MKDVIIKQISQYIKEYPKQKGTMTRWEEPIVAFASARDPMFIELKKIVSPTHALPENFLDQAETVISYFIPFQPWVAVSNVEGKESSKEWATAYVETNRLIYDINVYVKEKLAELGYCSTVIPATHNFNEEKLISDWSHRHVAWIAGLGKFGLNNMLITEKGCCGRIGTIVTNAVVAPTGRNEKESCLYKVKGICKKCAEQCVMDALKITEFDRHKCYEMCLDNAERYKDMGLADVCGKCLVNLPCSFVNPVKS
ncbi:MAG: epoxyqueuosine reductase [Bacillota bacterium]